MTPSMRELIAAAADSFEDYDWAVKLCTEAVRRAVEHVAQMGIPKTPEEVFRDVRAVMGEPAPEGEKR